MIGSAACQREHRLAVRDVQQDVGITPEQAPAQTDRHQAKQRPQESGKGKSSVIGRAWGDAGRDQVYALANSRSVSSAAPMT